MTIVELAIQGDGVIDLFHEVGGRMAANPSLSDLHVALWDLRNAMLDPGDHPVATYTLNV